jgi:stage II sporulation protein R
MKQFILLCILSIILVTNTEKIEQPTTLLDEQWMIPDEAIRLRILAHSDELRDQQVKYAVRNKVSQYVRNLVYDLDDINEARALINAHVPEIQQIVSETLLDYDKSYDSEVAFEKNVPFPEKTYGPYIYPKGKYEAILITLGEGKGKNWWCVLFPPLCFIDLFGETQLVDASEEDGEVIEELEDDEEDEEVEIRFFFLDLFNLS